MSPECMFPSEVGSLRRRSLPEPHHPYFEQQLPSALPTREIEARTTAANLTAILRSGLSDLERSQACQSPGRGESTLSIGSNKCNANYVHIQHKQWIVTTS